MKVHLIGSINFIFTVIGLKRSFEINSRNGAIGEFLFNFFSNRSAKNI